MTVGTSHEPAARRARSASETQQQRQSRTLKRMAALAHGAPVAIYHADSTGRLTYANALYRSMFQLSPDQPLDKWDHVVHPLDRQAMRDAWLDFCRRPRSAQFQWRSLSASGENRFLAETVVPMTVGSVGGFVGTITDVTELKAAQAEVKELQQRLMNTGQFGGEVLESLRRNARVAADLREALQRGEFELHYQPKLDVRTNQVVGAEALIRWRHPTRGLLSPAEFVPVAEEMGLIGPMGEWVIWDVCRQARAWQQQGLKPIRIALNLSPSQFRQTNLFSVINGALKEHSLDPRYLEIELTETTVMNDAESSAVILEHLSQMGVTLSVDDFGTGYSNLSYLRRFPVDKLKIDRTFIAEIMARPDDASIVQAIISLAHNLRLKVIAEGVETREQLEFLKQVHCDQYQGYYASKPLPSLEFAQFLNEAAASDNFMETAGTRTHSKLAAYKR